MPVMNDYEATAAIRSLQGKGKGRGERGGGGGIEHEKKKVLIFYDFF